MPPTGSLSIPRQDLTGSMYQAPRTQRFIGKRILRPMRVPSQTGRLGIVPVEAMYNMPVSATRNSDGGYNRINWKPTDDSWATVERGLEVATDDRKANLYRSYFDFEMWHYMMAHCELLRLQEKRISDLCYDTAVWTGTGNTAAASAAWSVASTVVLSDTNSAKKDINDKCGAERFGIEMSWKTWMDISRTTDLRGSIAYTRLPSGQIPLDTLASMLQVEEVVIANAPYNSANQGLTASLSKIWPTNKVFVYAIPETDSPEEPRLGNTLYWDETGGTEGLGAGEDEIVAEEYRDERVRGMVGRVRHETHEKIWSTLFGRVITGV